MCEKKTMYKYFDILDTNSKSKDTLHLLNYTKN